MRRFCQKAVWIAFLRAFWTLLFVVGPAHAAPPNPVIAIVDALDDDYRMLLTLLLHPKYQGRVKLIVVSTGNSAIKTLAVRRLVQAFDTEGQIQVVQGTPTDLSLHHATRFAHGIRQEGARLLTDSERRELNGVPIRGPSGLPETELLEFLADRPEESVPLVSKAEAAETHESSTQAAKAIHDLLSSLGQGEHADVLLATAPLDLVTAIDVDPRLAKQKLGDLFAMGLYRTVRAPGSKQVSGFGALPFNALADPETHSTVDLIRYFQSGVFQRFFHTSPDTLREFSGLPGGYPDSDQHSQAKLGGLREKMLSHPVLHLVLLAAMKYRSNWFEYVGKYGHGLLEGEQWIRDSIEDMSLGGSTGFYIADPSTAYLGSLTNKELGSLDLQQLKVTARKTLENSTDPIQFDLLGERSIHHLLSIDGSAIVDQHIAAVYQAPKFESRPEDFDYLAALEAAKSTTHEEALQTAIALDSNHLAGPLVVSFKNSPDDWYALLTLMGSPAAREALRKGGILCEGFEPVHVSDAVRRVLRGMGETAVPVVAGYEYQATEVSKFFNFGGERVLYGAGAGVRAFRYVPQAASYFPELGTAGDLLRRATRQASRYQHGIQLLILGSGLDVYRQAEKDPEFLRWVRGAYVMGGGRPNRANPAVMDVTRNWLIDTETVFRGMELFSLAGAEVDVFSSNVFGTNVSAVLDAEGSSVDGSMKDLYNFMRDGARIEFLPAIAEHWRLWGLAYEEPFLKGQRPYDPLESVKAVKTSLLGVYMSRALVEGRLQLGPVRIQVSKVDIRKLMGQGQSPTRVNWLEQAEGTVDTDSLALKLLASAHSLAVPEEPEREPWASCSREVLEAVYRLKGKLAAN